MRPPQTVFGALAGAVTTIAAIAIYWTMQGAHPWVEHVPTWPQVYGVFPTIGDGSNARGGIPPVVSEGKEPANIPSNYSVSKFITTNGSFPSVGAEAKFRTLCDFAFNGQFDPILYPNRPDLGHMHTFFGNTAVTAASNYASLRTTGDSTCAGGLINRSAYWYPSVMMANATGDGRVKIKVPDYTIVYYVTPSIATVPRMQRIVRGLGYVFGFNPADPNNTYVLDSYGPANLYQPGTGAGDDHGFKGWKCETTDGSTGPNAHPVPGYTSLQPWLRNADGTATLDCPTDKAIMAQLKGPGCWDGVNLMSPNGRKHVFPISANSAGLGTGPYCPEGWYHIAHFELVIAFSHNGYQDYKEWYLSSDRMTDAAFIHPDQECHDENVANGIPGSFCNGQTMHTDWFGAWDYDVMATWQKLCTGTSDESWGAGTYHECNDSQIGDGRKMDVNSFVSATALSRIGSWADLPGVKSPYAPNILVEGDSISVSGSLLYPGVFATAHPGVRMNNRAVGGSGLTNVESRKDADLLHDADILTLFIGANDIDGAIDTTAYINRLFAYAASFRAAGTRVAICTILPKISTTQTKTDQHNANRAIINAAILAAVGTQIDAACDFAANATMGPDAAASNLTYYSDGLHPTAAGHAILATIYGAMIDDMVTP